MHGKLCLSFESCKTLWLKALFVRRMVSSHTLCTIDIQISLFIKSEVFYVSWGFAKTTTCQCHVVNRVATSLMKKWDWLWSLISWLARLGLFKKWCSIFIDKTHNMACNALHCFSHFDCICKAHCNIIWQIVIKLWVKWRFTPLRMDHWSLDMRHSLSADLYGNTLKKQPWFL